jgi:hypothetical protein
MNQNDIDLDWNDLIAGFITDELIAGNVVKESDRQFAEKITAQQIHIALISGNRPDADSRRYRRGGVGFKP